MESPWKVGKSLMGEMAVVLAETGTVDSKGFERRPVPICRMGVGYNRTEEEALKYATMIAALPMVIKSLEEMVRAANIPSVVDGAVAMERALPAAEEALKMAKGE